MRDRPALGVVVRDYVVVLDVADVQQAQQPGLMGVE